MSTSTGGGREEKIFDYKKRNFTNRDYTQYLSTKIVEYLSSQKLFLVIYDDLNITKSHGFVGKWSNQKFMYSYIDVKNRCSMHVTCMPINGGFMHVQKNLSKMKS